MELIEYINAQYCPVYFHIFPYIYFLGYMYYVISVPLIMTENMRFRPYSYLFFFGTGIFDGWSA